MSAPASTDQRMVDLLEQQLAWTKAMALPGVRALADSSLTSIKERAAFEASDGVQTSRQVAAAAGASAGAVSGWWTKWRRLGLAVEGPGGRVRHLVSLTDLGLEVSK